jgi:hypothetical protein
MYQLVKIKRGGGGLEDHTGEIRHDTPSVGTYYANALAHRATYTDNFHLPDISVSPAIHKSAEPTCSCAPDGNGGSPFDPHAWKRRNGTRILIGEVIAAYGFVRAGLVPFPNLGMSGVKELVHVVSENHFRAIERFSQMVGEGNPGSRWNVSGR